MKKCFLGPSSQNFCSAFDLWRILFAPKASEHPRFGLFPKLPAAELTTDQPLRIYFYSVKQKRALLKSNPPRDNWMRRRNKKRPASWGGQKPPQTLIGDLYFRASHALKTCPSLTAQSQINNKLDPNHCPKFRVKYILPRS